MPQEVVEVRSGREAGTRFALTAPSVVVGRDPVHEWLLTDPRVSRTHARMSVRGGLLLVEDLGSTAGTLVNGRPVERPTPLRRGDVLTLGASELVVLWVPEPDVTQEMPVAATPPPPAPAAG
ncbi:MAG TPA: FHA domain-containing protein, partial [Miltoncostaeaceae bacterium]|nr:FHA domain-containing protein [Miltoncostaeaceae bacterium]